MTASPTTMIGNRRPPRVSATGAVLSVVACAWAALALLSALSTTSEQPVMTGHAGHHATPAMAAGPAYPWSLGWVAMWILMVVAMMWPLALPTVSAVSRASFRRWRVPMLLVCLGAFTVLWLAGGLALASVARLAKVPEHSREWQLAWVVLAVAALWSARRTRLWWRCAQLGPIAPSGRRGLTTSAQAGFISWRRCALLCGPLMAAMVVGHSPVVLVCASASSWWEATHRRAWRDRVPLLILAAAAAWLTVAMEVAGHG